MVIFIICLVVLIPLCALSYHLILSHRILKGRSRQKTEPGDNRRMFSIVRDLLLDGEDVSIAVRGQSMLPFFLSGQTVHLRPIRAKDIKTGHVVLADTGKIFVIHRIIKVDDKTVTLLGDGNIRNTERVDIGNVYGIIDCNRFHLFIARMWLWIRPLRRYPLWIIRRITPK